MRRRKFLRDTVVAGVAVPMASLTVDFLKGFEMHKLTILHTNDMHSRIEPFPMDGGRNAGMGGVAKRAALIKQIRAEEEDVLLLDCGDIFQGTPYFNVFGGELEMKLMSEMGYEAATIGNHDFDAGIDGLQKQMKHADFPFVISNYEMSDTIMAPYVQPYKVFQKGELKIGVYGLGIELDGLVPDTLIGNTIYQDPIPKAQYYEKLLKDELKCDLVVCISHLGFKYRDKKISDVVLAHHTSKTDIIIGGHTHTFLREPVSEKNALGEPILINQVGFGGILMGRLDVYFERKKKKNLIRKENILVN